MRPQPKHLGFHGCVAALVERHYVSSDLGLRCTSGMFFDHRVSRTRSSASIVLHAATECRKAVHTCTTLLPVHYVILDFQVPAEKGTTLHEAGFFQTMASRSRARNPKSHRKHPRWEHMGGWRHRDWPLAARASKMHPSLCLCWNLMTNMRRSRESEATGRSIHQNPKCGREEWRNQRWIKLPVTRSYVSDSLVRGPLRRKCCEDQNHVCSLSDKF